MPSSPGHAIVLDDHPLVGRGIAQYLQTRQGDLVVHEATSWAQVQALVEVNGCPAILVADVWLADSNSLATMAQWRSQCRSSPWLAISGDDDPQIQARVRSAGAQGFVHKQASPDVFGKAVVALLAGGEWFDSATTGHEHPPRGWLVSPAELGLTARQGEILALVLRGLPNKRIALLLQVSESTVKEHVTGILEKLGVRSRIEAITHLHGRRIHFSAPAAAHDDQPGKNAG